MKFQINKRHKRNVSWTHLIAKGKTLVGQANDCVDFATLIRNLNFKITLFVFLLFSYAKTDLTSHFIAYESHQTPKIYDASQEDNFYLWTFFFLSRVTGVSIRTD